MPRLCKLNCVMLYFISNLIGRGTASAKGGPPVPDERKITTI